MCVKNCTSKVGNDLAYCPQKINTFQLNVWQLQGVSTGLVDVRLRRLLRKLLLSTKHSEDKEVTVREDSQFQTSSLDVQVSNREEVKIVAKFLNLKGQK